VPELLEESATVNDEVFGLEVEMVVAAWLHGLVIVIETVREFELTEPTYPFTWNVCVVY